MNREDVRKLLGGYATGTLTPAEQEALFAAALDDQELFDALVKEEALREVLQDPASKARILEALEPAPAPARPAWWSWRPLIGAVAMAGIALAAVAVWRATRIPAPAPVTMAELNRPAAPPPPVESAPAPAPTAAAPLRQSQAAPKSATNPAPAARTEAEMVAKTKTETEPQPQPVKEQRRETVATADALAKDIPVVAGAPPPPQQQGQLAAPSPMVQQLQQQQAAPAAALAPAAAAPPAPVVERVTANGFRAAAGETVALNAAAKKGAPLLQWTILRDGRVDPPDTVLNAGETIRLRIVSPVAGTLTLAEGDRVLASASVRAARPYDTPPIPFTTAGPRLLRLSLTPGPPPVTITLNYAR